MVTTKLKIAFHANERWPGNTRSFLYTKHTIRGYPLVVDTKNFGGGGGGELNHKKRAKTGDGRIITAAYIHMHHTVNGGESF